MFWQRMWLIMYKEQLYIQMSLFFLNLYIGDYFSKPCIKIADNNEYMLHLECLPFSTLIKWIIKWLISWESWWSLSIVTLPKLLIIILLKSCEEMFCWDVIICYFCCKFANTLVFSAMPCLLPSLPWEISGRVT